MRSRAIRIPACAVLGLLMVAPATSASVQGHRGGGHHAGVSGGFHSGVNGGRRLAMRYFTTNPHAVYLLLTRTGMYR